jgi:hypothetical protein
MDIKCKRCGIVKKSKNPIKLHTKVGKQFVEAPCNKCRIEYTKSDEFKKIISDSKTGKSRPQWVRDKLSKSKKGKYTGTDNHWYKKTHSDEVKQLIRDYRLLYNAKLNGYESVDEYEKSKPARKRYYQTVWKLTKQVDKSLIPGFENLITDNTAGNEGAFHLDHIYPINEAFKNNIPAELIASLENLQFIPWLDNQKKSNIITVIPEHIQKFLDNK